jgi:hypothetical protein
VPKRYQQSAAHATIVTPALRLVSEETPCSSRRVGNREQVRRLAAQAFVVCPPAVVTHASQIPQSTVYGWQAPGGAGPRLAEILGCPRSFARPLLRSALALVEPPPPWVGSLPALVGAILVSTGQLSSLLDLGDPRQLTPEQQAEYRKLIASTRERLDQLEQIVNGAPRDGKAVSK